MRLPLSILVVGLMASRTLCAQSFDIIRVEVKGGKIDLHYSLTDTVARSYTVSLFSSADNFTSPLTKVAGDVGLEVKPGLQRKITWDATTELGADFNGDVALEVRGKVYIPFVRLDGFDDYKKFKRKKAYDITWTGGRGNSVLNFDLYKGDTKVATYPNIANVGHYKLKFENVRPGNDYRLKVSDAKNKDDVVYSAPFAVRAKVPMVIKMLGAAAAGAAITVLIINGKDTPVDTIKDPPKPKNN
jgi:hypothetical protein